MSTKTMNLTATVEKVFATLSFDESGHFWRLASEAEPNFQRRLSTQQDAFFFWYSRFDPTTGKLRD
jgi:hypothetical protein